MVTPIPMKYATNVSCTGCAKTPTLEREPNIFTCLAESRVMDRCNFYGFVLYIIRMCVSYSFFFLLFVYTRKVRSTRETLVFMFAQA